MNARLVRVALAAPLFAALLTAGGIVVTHGHAPGAPTPCDAATYAHRVALVVEHGNGRALRICIGFDSATISGEQILQASGIEFATAGYGSLGDAVCQIDNEPASYPSTCWTTTSPYWVLFAAHGGGAWSSAAHGVSTEMFGDGGAEGFRYDPQTGGAPPPVRASGTCPPAATAAPAAATPPRTRSPANPSAGDTAQSAPGSVAAATSATTRSPGVIGATPASNPAAGKPASVDAALLLAAGGGGALAGLLGVQLVRRRRRSG